MNTSLLKRISAREWEIPMHGGMRVPAIIYASPALLADMDSKVYEQAVNVAKLPGITRAAYAMPDAHFGHGFPSGSVAAFDPEDGGVISAGGVGSDIGCGVRCLLTGLRHGDLMGLQSGLADALHHRLPGGNGTGPILLSSEEVDDMLAGGARWAVGRGFGQSEDLERIEDHGRIEGAEPTQVSGAARKLLRNEVGTLGGGSHYIEVQEVGTLCDKTLAHSFGLKRGDIVLMIHCGSRGLGHQVGMDFMEEMVAAATEQGMCPPERELASAPIASDLARRYLGALRAAGNCALANRQILTHLVREIFADVLPQAQLSLLYDIAHNTCRVEEHPIDGRTRRLHVHRKGAVRALGPGHADLPDTLRHAGQPVLIGGSLGASSYVLAGTGLSERLAFSSACTGAGRTVSRLQARRRWDGRKVVMDLAARGIAVRGPSLQGVAEEAPGAYQDVDAVVDAADAACLARKVARLDPLVCIKG